MDGLWKQSVKNRFSNIKYAVVCLCLFFLPSAAFLLANVSGTTRADTIWGIAGSPYVLNGKVAVASGTIMIPMRI